MYVMTGIGVVIAIGFFIFSSKKEKITPSKQTGIDPKDLKVIPIGDYAGSYKTNRVTAHLAKG